MAITNEGSALTLADGTWTRAKADHHGGVSDLSCPSVDRCTAIDLYGYEVDYRRSSAA